MRMGCVRGTRAGRSRAGRYEPGDDRNDVEAPLVTYPADRLSRLSRMTGQLHVPVAEITSLRRTFLPSVTRDVRDSFLEPVLGAVVADVSALASRSKFSSVLEEEDVAEEEGARRNER
jgi:hypothetical protein